MQRPYKPGLRIIEDCPINLSENERGRLCTQLADPNLPRPGAGWVSLAFFIPVLWFRIHWIRIRIRIQHFKWIRIWIQDFNDQKLKERKLKIILLFLSAIAIYFSIYRTSIKDVQAPGEAFSPQKRTSSTAKNSIYLLFLFLWVILPSWIRIRKDCESGSGYWSRDPIESG